MRTSEGGVHQSSFQVPLFPLPHPNLQSQTIRFGIRLLEQIQFGKFSFHRNDLHQRRANPNHGLAYVQLIEECCSRVELITSVLCKLIFEVPLKTRHSPAPCSFTYRKLSTGWMDAACPVCFVFLCKFLLPAVSHESLLRLG